MDEILDKLREFMAKMDNRKFLNRLLVILIIFIFLLVALNRLTDFKQGNKKTITKEKKDEYDSIEDLDYSTLLEKKLARILERLKGVDKAYVMITLEDSIERIPASNVTKSTETTDETDSQGGSRKTKREEENRQLINSSDDVVVIKEMNPNIKGVIVIAEGAEDGEVLESIYEAVKTVLGIASNRIQVFPSK